MKRAVLLMLAGVLNLVFASITFAALIVDDFSVDSSFLTAPGTDTTLLGASSDFSLDRDLSIVKTGPANATAAVFAGELGISTDIFTSSDVTSSYMNAAGFDFTVAEAGGTIFEAFVLALTTIDQGGVDITLTVDGVSVTQNNVNAIGEVVFAHSSFTGVDFSLVNSIDLFIHNNVAVDATFDFFESRGPQQLSQPPRGETPEPDALWLIGIGLLGFAGMRYRKII